MHQVYENSPSGASAGAFILRRGCLRGPFVVQGALVMILNSRAIPSLYASWYLLRATQSALSAAAAKCARMNHAASLDQVKRALVKTVAVRISCTYWTSFVKSVHLC